MSEINRRDFGMALAAVAALAGKGEAQGVTDEPKLSTQRVFRYDELAVKKSANGGNSRAVLHGFLPTGEFVESHETELPPGEMPHPPHRHEHSELIMIREGTVVYYNDGVAEEKPIGPGDVIFTVSNKLHGMKNVGATTARYFVVAIGVQKTEPYPPK